MAGVRYRQQLRWFVLANALVTDERILGISGAPNPLQFNGHYLGAYFNATFYAGSTKRVNDLRIYGAATSNGFPAPGSATEALWTKSNIINSGVGWQRQPRIRTIDAGLKRIPILLPPWLLLEYSTGALGSYVYFSVDIVLIGPGLTARE